MQETTTAAAEVALGAELHEAPSASLPPLPPGVSPYQAKCAWLISAVSSVVASFDGLKIRFVRLPEQSAMTFPAVVAFEKDDGPALVVAKDETRIPRAWAAMPLGVNAMLPPQEVRPAAAAALRRELGLQRVR